MQLRAPLISQAVGVIAHTSIYSMVVWVASLPVLALPSWQSDFVFNCMVCINLIDCFAGTDLGGRLFMPSWHSRHTQHRVGRTRNDTARKLF